MNETQAVEINAEVASNLGEWLANEQRDLLEMTTTPTDPPLPRASCGEDATPSPGATRTVEQVADALRAAGGVMTAAAKMLRVHRSTLYAYLSSNRELRQVRAEIDEEMLDIAEGQLKKLVIAGDREAIKFYLRAKGKARGWRETVALTGENGGPVTVRAGDDVSMLSTEQLEAIVAGEFVVACS